MVDDLTRRQVPLEALLARHTEEAVHLTAHLRRDAERSAVLIGDKDGFDKTTRGDGEEVLARAILRELAHHGSRTPDGIALSEERAIGFGEVRHLIDGGDALVIEPLGYLLAREAGHA